MNDGESDGLAFTTDPTNDVSRARADTADLPYRLRGMVQSVERCEQAIDLLRDGFGEGQVARKMMAAHGLEYRRAWDYVMGALEVLARDAGRATIAQRRAVLLEKAQHTYRKALAKKRAYVAGESVELVDEPDLRAAQNALELEAKLYGVADAQSDQNAITRVLEVAKEVLPAAMWRELVLAVAKSSGRETAALPAGSGVEENDGDP